MSQIPRISLELEHDADSSDSGKCRVEKCSTGTLLILEKKWGRTTPCVARVCGGCGPTCALVSPVTPPKTQATLPQQSPHLALCSSDTAPALANPCDSRLVPSFIFVFALVFLLRPALFAVGGLLSSQHETATPRPVRPSFRSWCADLALPTTSPTWRTTWKSTQRARLSRTTSRRLRILALYRLWMGGLKI